jgi:hypothetical protein
MRSVYILSLAAGLASAAPTDVALPKITSISWSGNGCPQKSAKYLTGSGVSFGLTQFTVDDSSSASAADRTKNCEVHLSLGTGAQGWQVAVAGVSVHGHVKASAGSTLTAYASNYWSSSAADTVRNP